MTNKYEISTLKDIFEKVPLERIDVCMAEIAQGIKQAKAMNNLLTAAATAIGASAQGDLVKFPDVVTWIDDDKGEITMRMVAAPGDEPIATIQTRMS